MNDFSPKGCEEILVHKGLQNQRCLAENTLGVHTHGYVKGFREP